MDRINGAGTVDIGGGRRGFRDEDLAVGQEGTQVTAVWLTMVQEEVLKVIEATGGAPSESDWTQLAKAIQGGKLNFAVAAGTANAWVVDPALAVPAYSAGRVLWIIAPGTNTSTTVNANVSGLGNRRIKKANGQDPQPSDLVSGVAYPTLDDGTNIRIIAPLPSDMRAAALNRTRAVFATPGAISWTVPAGVQAILVKVWAAGGGGGSAGSAGASSGGSGGSYFEKFFQVTAGQVVTGTVGAGGAAGVWGGTLNGSAGGDSSIVIAGTTYTAAGGGGGLGKNGGGSPSGTASPPPPALPTAGDINLRGGQGQPGICPVSPSVNSGNGGNGAGAGGAGGVGGGGGAGSGETPGGGGGGGSSGLSAGAGARGEIWIEY